MLLINVAFYYYDFRFRVFTQSKYEATARKWLLFALTGQFTDLANK